MVDQERLTGALADRYTIEREIGSGGMATVYLALDLKHHRPVAIKVLDPELARSLGAERFLREIETAAKLTHPHILPLHDSGEADGLLYFVMPYVEGESLRSRLTREKQLPVDDAVRIAREIADALAYSHERGVIHRDVKPANIMLEAGHAVLADFGVAHAVAGAGDQRITRAGTSPGTPEYMSPEQAGGERELDGRSDQYALGCVLYEMLAGHPPFTGAQVEAVLHQQLTAEPRPVTQARPSVGRGTARVVQRALSKRPADRFKTTDEMAAALATVTTSARPVVTRLPWLTVIGAATLAVVGLVAVGLWMVRPRGPAGLDSRVVAVMPFRNLTGSPDLDHLGQMASHFLTQELARTGLVEVRSYESAVLSDRYVRSQSDGGAPAPPPARRLRLLGSPVQGAVLRHHTDLGIGAEPVALGRDDDQSFGRRPDGSVLVDLGDLRLGALPSQGLGSNLAHEGPELQRLTDPHRRGGRYHPEGRAQLKSRRTRDVSGTRGEERNGQDRKQGHGGCCVASHDAPPGFA
jgi:serine/threonine-protein kinase